MKKVILTAVLITISSLAFCQTDLDTLREHRNVEMIDNLAISFPWFFTSNPAGIGTLGIETLSNVETSYGYENDGFKESQNPGRTASYKIGTMGYKKIRKMTFFGSFSYLNQQYDDLIYNSVMRFDHWSPLIVGDTVNGRQFREEFNLKGALSMKITDKLSLGADVDYISAVGAKLKDPRNLNYISYLAVSPAIKYKAGKWDLGLKATYMDFNQYNNYKIISNENHTYYIFYGMGYWEDETPNGSFSNLYFGHGFGVSGQAVFDKRNITSVSELAYTHKKETMASGTNYRYLDGIAYLDKIDISNQTILKKPGTLYIFRTNVNIDLVAGDRIEMNHFNIRESEYYDYDSLYVQTWEKNAELDYKINADLSYEYRSLGENGDENLSLTCGINLVMRDNAHYPLEIRGFFTVSNLTVYGSVSKRFISEKLQLKPSLKIWYRTNLMADYDYNEIHHSFPEIVYNNFNVLSCSLAGTSVSLTAEKMLPKGPVTSVFFKPAGTFVFSPDLDSENKFNYILKAAAGITF